MSQRRFLTLVVAVLVVAVLKGVGSLGVDLSEHLPRELSQAAAPEQGTYRSGAGGDLDEMLDQVSVVPDRPSVPGYDRECGTGHACSFGQDWSDDVDVHGGHNGCDTRNDILARDLVDLELRPDTNECVVIAGTLADPYIGEQISFLKEEAYEVGVDHVFALARAWDLGAAAWTIDQRRNFANDPINLLAVSGSANSSKSDRGPGEWMPLNASYRCSYVVRYLEVAIAYELPIVQADHEAARILAPYCTRLDTNKMR